MTQQLDVNDKGILFVVGLGPGDESLLSPLARRALEQSRVIAGYGRYVDLVSPELKAGRELIVSGMTKEVDRCKAALDAARSGKSVSLVCSGDPGIYALAGLVLEIMEVEGLSPEELPVEIIPGVPAVCAAAARLGAPLMHDFACISFSDLLTPWELIEKRLEAAMSADFVLAIYNPSSRSRGGNFARALELMRDALSPDTPVGVVREAYRPDEKIWLGTLRDLDPARVDMLSILIVGNSQSRVIFAASSAPRLLTPRGYARKYEL